MKYKRTKEQRIASAKATKLWFKNNKERAKIIQKKYLNKNREYWLKYKRDYAKKYYKKKRKDIPPKFINGINLSQIRKDGKPWGSAYDPSPNSFKTTEFHKKYGMTLTEMGKQIGISKEAVRKRFLKGYPDITIKPNLKFTYKGKTIQEWAKELNVSRGLMYWRIKTYNDPHYNKFPKKGYNQHTIERNILANYKKIKTLEKEQQRLKEKIRKDEIKIRLKQEKEQRKKEEQNNKLPWPW